MITVAHPCTYPQTVHPKRKWRPCIPMLGLKPNMILTLPRTIRDGGTIRTSSGGEVQTKPQIPALSNHSNSLSGGEVTTKLLMPIPHNKAMVHIKGGLTLMIKGTGRINKPMFLLHLLRIMIQLMLLHLVLRHLNKILCTR